MKKEHAGVQIIQVGSDPEPAAKQAADILPDGGVIGYPTETVYGLGCDCFHSEAVKRIREIKRRTADKPFLVLLPNTESLLTISGTIPESLEALAEHFWPGPLTLLVPHRNQFPESLTLGQPRIGVRVSSDPFCAALTQSAAHPVVSTSANPAGKPSAQSAPEVIRYFGDRIDLILDGGERTVCAPSTILDVSFEKPRLIREGAIPIKTIEKKLGFAIER